MRKANAVAIVLIIVAGILLYLRSTWSVFHPIDYKFVKIGMSGESMDELDWENKGLIEKAKETGSKKKNYAKTITVRTREELEQTGWNHSVFDSYNDTYFEKNNLCILIIEESTGENIYGVKSISRVANNVLNIEIINYGCGTTDVIEHTMGLIEIDKKHFNDETISNGICTYIQEHPKEDVKKRNM